jgi:hypothetical protein
MNTIKIVAKNEKKVSKHTQNMETVIQKLKEREKNLEKSIRACWNK